jgi:hypothetical protein
MTPERQRIRALLNPLSQRQDTNATAVDLTSEIDSNATSLSYSPSPLPNDPYNGTDGYSYQLMTVPDGSMVFIACGNGAIYGVTPDADDNPACLDMWATYDDILVADSSKRLLHYYGNTMNATGVSRLRVSDEETLPEGAEILAFVAMSTFADSGNDTAATSDNTTSSNGDDYYLAVDPDFNIFYPIYCTYTDGQVGKLFVASDPVAGVPMLESAALEFSVTGGTVGACYAMPILFGSYGDGGGDYESLDSAAETDDSDILKLDGGASEKLRRLYRFEMEGGSSEM